MKNENVGEAATVSYSRKQIQGWKKSLVTMQNKVMKAIPTSLTPDLVSQYEAKIKEHFTALAEIYVELEQKLGQDENGFSTHEGFIPQKQSILD